MTIVMWICVHPYKATHFENLKSILYFIAFMVLHTDYYHIDRIDHRMSIARFLVWMLAYRSWKIVFTLTQRRQRNKTHRTWFFGPFKIPLTREISIFRPNFENLYLENGPRFFRQVFGICRPSAYPQNEILKSGVGPQIWAWGRVEFSIGPRARPPGGETVLCRPARFRPNARH